MVKEKKIAKGERIVIGLSTGRTDGRWQCYQTWAYRGGPCAASAQIYKVVLMLMLGGLGASTII